ncbi:transcriptional regulator with XRE-family HTH domain [Massilia aurea]|uniref:Transcriptional regulator with XRE-family HTH domain n=1 Tax=Massilia aurea TaxID=373040 RepID=A0A7X0CG68_9BURK|nr:helix-turn-helix transcriptional regulator [Massilia aurea]MBB6135868.1 transcriptional regulator with XRE-family HTH domain [Massilia aurea]
MDIDPVRLDDSHVLAAIGAAIRSLRKEQGLSQEELSYLSSIDRSHMGRVERGERNLSMLNLVRISRGIGCQPSEIMKTAGL